MDIIHYSLGFLCFAALCCGIIFKYSPDARLRLGLKIVANALADKKKQEYFKENYQNLLSEYSLVDETNLTKG